MNINDIKELVKFIKSNKVSEFSYKKGDEEFTVKIESDNFKSSVKAKKNFQEQKEYFAQIMQIEQAELNKISSQSISSQEVKEFNELKNGTDNFKEIVSPFVGAFYRSPTPDKPPFVEINTIVEKNGPVCIIEAMKLMNEIEVDIKCRIVSILVENGQVVEYGQPLFLIEPL